MNPSLALGVCYFLAATLFAATAGENVNKTQTAERSVVERGIWMSATVPEVSIVGLAVNVKIRVANKSKADIEFRAMGKYRDYDLTLLDSKGRLVPLTQFGKVAYGGARDVGSGLEGTLGAGKEMHVTLNLSRIFDLSLEGEYKLNLSRSLGATTLKIDGLKFRLVEGQDR